MANAPNTQPSTRMELAPGVRLVVSEGGASHELFHPKLGLRQVLNGAEYQIFAELQRGTPFEEVRARSDAARRLCERLVGAGFIRPAQPAASFLPDDRPRLASGVKFQRTQQQDIVIMTPPGGSPREMREIEAVIARAFDGAHSVLDVVEAARVKGIPATLPNMTAFLRELHAMGFLEETHPMQDDEINLPIVQGAEAGMASPAIVTGSFLDPDVEQPSSPQAPREPSPPPDARLDALRSLSLEKEETRGGALKWVVGLVVIGAAAGGAWKLGYLPSLPASGTETPSSTQEASASPQPTAAAELRTATLEAEAPQGIQVRAAGYIAARDPIVLGATVGGRVSQVLVENGQLVKKKGQILVQLDDMQTRAEIGLARAKRTDAERLLERTKTLVASKAATQSDLERAVGQAEIARAEHALQAARLEQARLRSPIANATILEVLVRPGEVLTPSNDAAGGVVKLADLSKLVAEVDVNEGDVFRLRPGLVAEVIADAATSRTYQGVVREIAQEADRARGTVLVKVDLQVPDRSLRPGNSVKVTFQPASEARILVPRTALVSGGTVWLVGKDGKVSSRRVGTRPAGPDLIEITSGVEAGDKIVVSGGERLRAGEKIE